jgi:DNA-binding transcriptional ArsR family regulator
MVLLNPLSQGRKKGSPGVIISSAVIPIIFLLSAFSASINIPFENEVLAPSPNQPEQLYDNNIAPDTDFVEGSVALTELKPAKVNSPGLISGPLANEELDVTRILKTPGYDNSMQGNDELISSAEGSSISGSSNGKSGRASGLDLTISENFDYTGIIDELGYYAAAEVGKKTTFSFTIENVGTESGNNVQVTWKMLDFYDREAISQVKTIPVLDVSGTSPITFDWIPTYSNYYNITLNVSVPGDVNGTNNDRFWKWIIAVKWSDDFATSSLDDWTGDKGTSVQWHVSNTVNNDPDTLTHSSPEVLYHGEENGQDKYGIGEDYYLTFPPFDLRRFETTPVTYLFYQFYGSSSPQDELILEVRTNPNQDFEYSDLLPKLSGDTKNESGGWEWQAWLSESAPFSGIPISIFTGEIVQFRLHWVSDNTPENKTGFYLDDFLLFGLEIPPPEKDAGLDELKVDHFTNPWDMPVVGDNIDISVKVKNYGKSTLTDFQVKLSIKDEQGRFVTKINSPSKTVHSLEPGLTTDLNWTFIPEIGGNFYIELENLLADDGWVTNDDLNTTITVARFYYSSEESVGLSTGWESDGSWKEVDVPTDPDPSGHSKTKAWYMGDENYTYSPDMEAILKSSVIDLQGVNSNNPDIKIFTNFKFYGSSSESDILYFEYALDGTDEWELVNDGGALGDDYTTSISGYYGMHWYDLDSEKTIQVGSTQFIGHSVQFRWRFVSDNIDEALAGFFIDDFVIWGIEEDYGRPTVASAKSSKPAIENQLHDSTLLTAHVIDRDNNLVTESVTIDLTPLGDLTEIQMYDDGTHGDLLGSDGIFSLNVSAGPEIVPGMKLLVIDIEDSDSNNAKGFIKLEVIRNPAPVLSDITPAAGQLDMAENESINFSLLASDPGDELTYRWQINGETVLEGSDLSEFEFNSDFEGNYSSGIYKLNVTVFDDAEPAMNSSVEWEVTIRDILPDLELNSSSVQVSNLKPVTGEKVYFNVTLDNLGLKPEYDVEVTLFLNQNSDAGESNNSRVPLTSFTLNDIGPLDREIISLEWTASKGLGLTELIIFADPDNNIMESDEDNNKVSIYIELTEPPEDLPPIPKEESLYARITGSGFFMSMVILIVVTSSLMGFAAAGTEFGRYRLFSLMVPLYSRMKGSKILSHTLREQIYNHIKKYPGDHYRSIMNKLELKNGTLVHHLTRLEQEELIKSERDGLYKRFYPIGMKIPRSNVGMYYPDGTVTYNISDRQVSKIQMNILEALNKTPGLSQKELSDMTGESRRVINYHIKLLMKSHLIKVQREGRETKCFLEVELT